MKIDLHNHTTASPDSTTTPKQFVNRAILKGVGAIAVTDHNTMDGVKEVEKEARGKPLTVIPAEEIFCKEGEIIGLFLIEPIKQGLPAEEVLDEIKSQGALSYAPHPFDPLRHGLNKEELLKKVDIVEVFNSKATQTTDEEAMRFADLHNKVKGAGSDSHTPLEIGRAYVLSEQEEVDTPEKLLRALKSGVPKIERRTTLMEKVARKAHLKLQKIFKKGKGK